jgi:hypothetical protein
MSSAIAKKTPNIGYCQATSLMRTLTCRSAGFLFLPVAVLPTGEAELRWELNVAMRASFPVNVAINHVNILSLRKNIRLTTSWYVKCAFTSRETDCGFLGCSRIPKFSSTSRFSCCRLGVRTLLSLQRLF